MVFIDRIFRLISMIQVTDVIDILIVTYVIYKIILLIKDTKAQSLIKGIVLLLVIMQVSGWIGLNTINYILKSIMEMSVFAILIVFQPEIRRMLDMVGRSRLTNSILFNFDDAVTEERTKNTIDQTCQAVMAMANAKIGALIVIEKETKIGEIISTGTLIDSEITSELIRNVFYPKAPLHDGALIIRNNRIYAAGCFLPLSQQDGISRELGTRHRAALGMSEYSDAIVVVVSEETGRISIAKDGTLIRNLTSKALSSILTKSLIPKNREENKKFKFWRWKA